MSDGEEEYEQATPEQKIHIATYFIMSSPTGEVKDVVKDVSTLVGDSSVLSDEALRGIMHEYNTQTMVSAPAPSDGHAVLVTPFGEVDQQSFVDPNTGKVLVFDHLAQEFTAETDQKQLLEDGVNQYRVAIDNAVKQYVSNSYKDGKCTVAVYGADDGNITVCISAKNVRLSSYWTGGWRSRFSLSGTSHGTQELSANIKVNVHYFEDGNVQLNTDHSKTVKVSVADPASTAKAVASAIEKIECDFQNNLEDMYVSMHQNTFKAMRRILPLSRQPMEWNKHKHSLASEMSSS